MQMPIWAVMVILFIMAMMAYLTANPSAATWCGHIAQQTFL
jgi:hypothetical protein